ncbi:MAG: (2Fe-2S)-binding protein [Porticoccaceae bacterium]|nr:(2Fe-2S)-binding protein [Porticoccaceae bacterium]
MYVCVCRGVTEKQIRREVQNGAATYDEIQARLDVGICCGTCRDTAEALIAETSAQLDQRSSNVIDMWTPRRQAV